jgi:hypothetical protein
LAELQVGGQLSLQLIRIALDGGICKKAAAANPAQKG